MDFLYNWIPEFWHHWYHQDAFGYGFVYMRKVFFISSPFVFIGSTIKMFFHPSKIFDSSFEKRLKRVARYFISVFFSFFIVALWAFVCLLLVCFFPVVLIALYFFGIVSSVTWMPLWIVGKIKALKCKIKKKQEDRLKQIKEWKEMALRRLERDGLHDVIKDLEAIK